MVFRIFLIAVFGPVLILGAETHGIYADIEHTSSHIIIEYQIEVETARTGVFTIRAFALVCGVIDFGNIVRISKSTLDSGIGLTGHQQEVGSHTPVVPLILDRAVVVDFIHEIETEDIEFRAALSCQSNLSV